MILLSVSCQSQRQNLKVDVEFLDIEVPYFPYFDKITELEDCIEIEWNNQLGYLPKDFFYALAEYVNSVDAIRVYVTTYNQEIANLPP